MSTMHLLLLTLPLLMVTALLGVCDAHRVLLRDLQDRSEELTTSLPAAVSSSSPLPSTLPLSKDTPSTSPRPQSSREVSSSGSSPREVSYSSSTATPRRLGSLRLVEAEEGARIIFLFDLRPVPLFHREGLRLPRPPVTSRVTPPGDNRLLDSIIETTR